MTTGSTLALHIALATVEECKEMLTLFGFVDYDPDKLINLDEGLELLLSYIVARTVTLTCTRPHLCMHLNVRPCLFVGGPAHAKIDYWQVVSGSASRNMGKTANAETCRAR